MPDYPILYGQEECSTIYRWNQGRWEASSYSWEQIPFQHYHILLEDHLVPPFYAHGIVKFYGDKIATIAEVLAGRVCNRSLVLFCLERQDKHILFLFQQRKCILQRAISLPLEEEIERTKKFMNRFNDHGELIHVCFIAWCEVLDDLRVMAKLWCDGHHPLAALQWYTFWRRWVPRVGWTLSGVLSIFLFWQGGEMMHDYPQCHHLSQQVVALDPLPKEAYLFLPYKNMKKEMPQIADLTTNLQEIVEGRWVADEIEWGDNQWRLRFQVHPDFVKDIAIYQHHIATQFPSNLTWDIQDGDPTFIHLHIPVS